MIWRALLQIPSRYRWTAVYVGLVTAGFVCLCVAGGAR